MKRSLLFVALLAFLVLPCKAQGTLQPITVNLQLHYDDGSALTGSVILEQTKQIGSVVLQTATKVIKSGKVSIPFEIDTSQNLFVLQITVNDASGNLIYEVSNWVPAPLLFAGSQVISIVSLTSKVVITKATPHVPVFPLTGTVGFSVSATKTH